MTSRAVAGLGLLAVLGLGALPAAAATRQVRVGSMYYEDQTPGDGRIVIQAGDRITFSFDDGPHTATVDGLFDSDQQTAGRTYTTGALTRPGTYTLYCRAHGAAEHSTALVIRQAAATPSPTRKPSTAPSPRRTPAPRPTPSPSPTPSASASASASASPAASASSLPVIAAPSRSASTGTPTPVPSLSPAPDVDRATPIDDSGSAWMLPALLVLVFAAGAGAIALGRRRNG